MGDQKLKERFQTNNCFILIFTGWLSPISQSLYIPFLFPKRSFPFVSVCRLCSTRLVQGTLRFPLLKNALLPLGCSGNPNFGTNFANDLQLLPGCMGDCFHPVLLCKAWENYLVRICVQIGLLHFTRIDGCLITFGGDAIFSNPHSLSSAAVVLTDRNCGGAPCGELYVFYFNWLQVWTIQKGGVLWSALW